MNERAFQRYLATGEYVPTEDAAPTSLEAHDRRFHPDGYKEGDSCKYREELARGDNADLVVAEATEQIDKEGDIDKPIKISSDIRKSSLRDREYAVKNILKAAVKNALSKLGKDSIPGLYDEPTPWYGNLNHNEDVYLIAGKSNNSLMAVVHRNDEEVKFRIVKDNGYQKDEPRSIRKAIEKYEETFK